METPVPNFQYVNFFGPQSPYVRESMELSGEWWEGSGGRWKQGEEGGCRVRLKGWEGVGRQEEGCEGRERRGGWGEVGKGGDGVVVGRIWVVRDREASQGKGVVQYCGELWGGKPSALDLRGVTRRVDGEGGLPSPEPYCEWPPSARYFSNSRPRTNGSSECHGQALSKTPRLEGPPHSVWTKRGFEASLHALPQARGGGQNSCPADFDGSAGASRQGGRCCSADKASVSQVTSAAVFSLSGDPTCRFDWKRNATSVDVAVRAALS